MRAIYPRTSQFQNVFGDEASSVKIIYEWLVDFERRGTPISESLTDT